MKLLLFIASVFLIAQHCDAQGDYGLEKLVNSDFINNKAAVMRHATQLMKNSLQQDRLGMVISALSIYDNLPGNRPFIFEAMASILRFFLSGVQRVRQFFKLPEQNYINSSQNLPIQNPVANLQNPLQNLPIQNPLQNLPLFNQRSEAESDVPSQNKRKSLRRSIREDDYNNNYE